MLDELINNTDQIKLNEVEGHDKNMWVSLNESTGELTVELNSKYEVELMQDLIILEEIKERIATKTEEIKNFIESNKLGSFKTDMLAVKYVSATTTTSIDTALLKKELPDIAAKYSKTSPRASSVSIKLAESKK